MKITSDFKFDYPSLKEKPGSYEWWYFDAADLNNEWQVVIIFYEGCPFSTRYNHLWVQDPKGARAANHPAVSISLYYKGKAVFYSTSEYEPEQAAFVKKDAHNIEIRIGNNHLHLRQEAGRYQHTITLDEQLPSGDALFGNLIFVSAVGAAGPSDETTGPAATHGWNLTQPRATVKARLKLQSSNKAVKEVSWSGLGYHDHNLGEEPMAMQFKDWYWGRFHFPEYTLVYYLMNTGKKLDYKGWLLDTQGQVQYILTDGELGSFMSNIFMLKAGRTIRLNSAQQASVMIQQSQVLDSGPFYYRFRSEAILHLQNEDVLQQGTGITEYIRPARIHHRLFWPLVHMRYRYANKPHWVQKSPRMYRWTW